MRALTPSLGAALSVSPRHGVIGIVKKKQIWLIVGGLLVLDALTGVPGFPAIMTKTHTLHPADYSESGARITTTFCRGVPFLSKSCEVRIRMLSTDSGPV